MNKFKIIILMMLFITSSVYSQHVGKLKVNHCVWKFKDCGQVMIDGKSYRVRGMNTIDFENQHETTIYTDSNHVVTVQRTRTTYYFNVLYPNGKVTCEEFTRDILVDWFLKVFVLP
jgi:hypothetical protein